METKKQLSKGRLWTSYILQGLVIIMFLQGAVQYLLKTDMAVESATTIGFSESAIFYFGLILLIITLLYAIPKTSVLGAILITAWLGGAVVAHILHRDVIGFILFPVFFGIIVWFSIWLRSEQLWRLIPIKK